MAHDSTSLQAQSPLAQAQDSADKARRAVDQALSYSSRRMIEQADNALDKAWRAAAQAEGSETWQAVEETKERLQTAEMDLDRARADKMKE
ncbi:hypothetical protein [Alicyclobacillus shizuokensis]|uniref:hypothetical protein n=1 Tax=Alicyclobacillus shizuokensis TaxID=392014 RepID=UPI0008350B3A|nr:hypothetical protein [Alicyclobacillus shizuokensis]MCL6625770.1 hypothetical protein [Alicyclobacillus shizuokensis]